MTGRSLPHAILMMIPEPWSGDESMSPGAQGLLRVPLVADGAVGRPGVDRVHRRHGDRRRARPQRAAAVALLRHEGRPGRHGVGGRRARHPARGHRAQGAAASGPHLPRRHGAGPDRVGRGDQARAGRRPSVSELAGRPAHRHRGSAGGAASAAAQPRDGAEPAAGLRLHAGGSADPARADGDRRRGGDRIDGHRHVARGAVGSAAPAVRLFQAALRAGHQSAARRDPRGAGDDDGVDDRAGRQPARPAARVVPADQDQVSGHRQRPAREAAARLRARLPVDHAADAVRPAPGRPGPRAGDGGPEAAGPATRSTPATPS